MKKYGVVSNYTVTQYKMHKQPANDDSFPNEVNQQSEGRNHLEVIVSDLTYVRVAENKKKNWESHSSILNKNLS